MSATVAVATCSVADIDSDQPLLLDALERAGVTAFAHAWDDASVQWDQFDLVVLRSTWDYATRREEFLSWARQIPRLHNPFDVIERNSDKHYLADLDRLGTRVIATEFFDVGEEPRWPEGHFVVKPSVGAGSFDADRYGANDHRAALEHVKRLHARGRDVMVQPYVHSIDREGETALIFIDGQFVHAMNKGPMLNVAESDRDVLFRREQMRAITVDNDVIEFAEGALHAVGGSNLLYARVDVVNDNGWAVMEIELTEPSLFLGFRPEAADQLASAIVRRVAQ